MDRAIVVVFTLLLVISLPAPAVAAADQPAGSDRDVAPETGFVSDRNASQYADPVETANTTNRLRLAGEIRAEHTDHSNDLGTALASKDDELRFDQEQHALVDSGFDDASAEEQAEMVQANYDRLKDRIDDLESREQAIVREHAEGDRSTTELLQTLIRNHNQGTLLSDRHDELGDLADRVPGYSVPVQERRATEKVFDAHQTDIRTALDSSSPGDQQTELLVQTSESGYSVSTVDSERYLVETIRFDNRDSEREDQFEGLTASDTLERTMAFYPWVSEESNQMLHRVLSSENLYWLDVGHSQGRLEAYIDGGLERVHRENQQLSVGTLPIDNERSVSSGSIEVTVAETPANGPAAVSVTDDGETRNATVSIDGTEVGETGDDGSLWILPPDGEYDVEVTISGEIFELPVGNERPPPEDDDDGGD